MAKKKFVPNPSTIVRGRFIGGGLFEPREDRGKMKFSALIVLEDGEDKKVDKIVGEAIKRVFPDANDQPKDEEVWGVREGDNPDFEHSFEKKFINPKSNENRPPLTVKQVGGKAIPVTVEDDLLYPGCNVAVKIEAYAYNKANRGATLSLISICFLSHGDRLSMRTSVVSDEEYAEFESEVSEPFDDEALDVLA